MESEGVRRRKGVGASGQAGDSKGDNQHEGSGGRSASIDRTCTYLILLVTVAVASCILLVYTIPDHPFSIILMSLVDRTAHILSLTTPFYAVVLDAGSTGSRVLGFTFFHSPVTGNLVLEDELWHEIKPGLSSFATNPTAGADTISELLEMAKDRIPADKRSSVPVTLKATAGLRLLPADQSQAIIDAVQERLEKSGFDNRGVGMASELEEGVFGWVTVNYLLDQLHNPRKSYVALDLGGGSTQITFLPKYDETFKTTPESFLHQISVLGKEHTVYSHSYLGLGLMAARAAIFNHNQKSGDTKLESPCMVTSGATKWSFHGKDYTINPSTAKVSGYEGCMLIVHKIIDAANVDQCEEVPTRKIAAFSYFHDKAVEAGLIKKGESGVITVQNYLDAASDACNKNSKSADENPFLCTDLSFIAGLLHHGYRLAPQAKLGIYKEINGHQTSWALGAAFNMLNLG